MIKFLKLLARALTVHLGYQLERLQSFLFFICISSVSQRSAENDFILKEFMDIKNQEREERATGSTNAKKARMREMELLLQKCETSWDRIREISETDDLEQLLNQFTETERENFALFNFINELNNIIEQESEEIEHINAKFDEDKENMLSSDEDRNERLQALKDKVETERSVNLHPPFITINSKVK